MLPFFLCLVYFDLGRRCVPAILFLLDRTLFFLLALYPSFSNIVSTGFNLLVCSSFVPRVTIRMSSNHTGVPCPSVGSIFSWKLVGMCAGP